MGAQMDTGAATLSKTETAILRLRTAADGPSEQVVRELLGAAGYRVASCGVGYAIGDQGASPEI